MKVYDRERQDWADGRRERLHQPDRDLDLPRQQRVVRRGGMVLATVGMCFGVWAFGWKDEPEPPPPPPSPTAQEQEGTGPTDPATDTAEATDGTATASGVLPDGYTEVQDDEGFRIAVPADWTAERRPSQYGIEIVNYSSPDGLRRLQIFQLEEFAPYDSLVIAEEAAARQTGYERIEMGPIPSAPDDAAEHEYRATEIAGESDSGTVRHVIDHRFRASDGNRYALVAYGPDNQDSAERELIDTAAAWFCPPGTTCPAPDGSDAG
ncbi:hypothetical protein [Streptomyces nigra]|uniref:hypothetical protein n=1 Tax=Streptomyces nigra TaxID=1827580 RepID=UPI0035DAA7C8